MKAIGLMSGTSMDGIDVAFIETNGETIDGFGPSETFAYNDQERQLLREAISYAKGAVKRTDRTGVLKIAEAMVTARHIACIAAFIGRHALDKTQIGVAGFHGQTVLHRPETGVTMQLGDGQLLARQTGIRSVYDFRAQDMAEGGQGAPLVPVYHRALALRLNLPLPALFINIGGVSNFTYVPDAGPERMAAFDAGPGNALLDDWMLRHTGAAMDHAGKIALSGTVDQKALQTLLSDPYFKAPPPKSADRNAFSASAVASLDIAAGAATLTAFTVAAIAMALRHLPDKPSIHVICGGGARNPAIVGGLKRILPGKTVTADEAGIDAGHIEAQAFAFLAVRKLKNLPSTFPGTTGVRRPVCGGTIAMTSNSAAAV